MGWVILEANVGRTIVTNGNLWRSCAKVCEPSELQFRVVCWVDQW